jgi:hypothetical protein
MALSRPSLPWSRLIAEFLVIVVGVVVALGVDQWAQGRRDRALEEEYLERLLGDVRYDIEELTFIRERSSLSADQARSVLDAEWVRRAPVDSLVGTAYGAFLTRIPDLSRSTFNELVSSGRIDLLRSRAVREALAEYDRANSELLGFYDLGAFEGLRWMWARLPPDQRVPYESACRGDSRGDSRELLRVCPFDWDLDVTALRGELVHPETVQLLRGIANRNTTAVLITETLLQAARNLEAVLAESVAAL